MILIGEKIDHVDLLSVLDSCIDELTRGKHEIAIKKVSCVIVRRRAE